MDLPDSQNHATSSRGFIVSAVLGLAALAVASGSLGLALARGTSQGEWVHLVLALLPFVVPALLAGVVADWNLTRSRRTRAGAAAIGALAGTASGLASGALFALLAVSSVAEMGMEVSATVILIPSALLAGSVLLVLAPVGAGAALVAARRLNRRTALASA